MLKIYNLYSQVRLLVATFGFVLSRNKVKGLAGYTRALEAMAKTSPIGVAKLAKQNLELVTQENFAPCVSFEDALMLSDSIDRLQRLALE